MHKDWDDDDLKQKLKILWILGWMDRRMAEYIVGWMKFINGMNVGLYSWLVVCLVSILMGALTFFFLRFGVSFLTVSPLYSYSTTTRARPQQQYLINAAVVRVQKKLYAFWHFLLLFFYTFLLVYLYFCLKILFGFCFT